MDRRGFLGRVLGTIVGSQVPWVAREFDPLFDPAPDKPKKPGDLAWYRTGIRLSDGTLLEGPGLSAMARQDDALVFTFFGVEVKEIFQAVGAVLMDCRGTIIRESRFHNGWTLWPGDTLKVTFTLRGYEPWILDDWLERVHDFKDVSKYPSLRKD